MYNIQLPETIELDEFKINDLFQLIKNEIAKSTEEITLDKLDKPNIELLQRNAILSYQKINKKISTAYWHLLFSLPISL